MSTTPSAVKRKYNAKTYSRWTADLRKEDFEKIEQLRGDLSRSQFLLKLVEAYYPEEKAPEEAQSQEL